MKNVYDNILDYVGNTPLVRLNKVTAGYKSNVYAKCEFLNPAGSIKDRIAIKILDDYKAQGKIKPGGTVIEGTSGNTGAGLAMVSAIRGYKSIFVLPDKQSEDKRAGLRAWGSRVVVTPTDVDPDDPRSYYRVSARLVEETPNSVYANQYHNPSNPDTHYEWTGPELYEQLEGKIDVFIAGLGTGGTITGIGRYLKEQNPDIKVVGIDPVGSLYYDYFHTGQLTKPYVYMVEGIGEDFLPSTMDFQYVDDVIRVNDKECFQMTRRVVREEGLFCGASSGAAVAGGLKYLQRADKAGLNVVILFPDGGYRYLTKVFNDSWMEENGFMNPDTGLGKVSDLCKQMGERALVSIPASARVAEAIGELKLHGISQVPVMDGGQLIGILNETRLLERALRGGSSQEPVRELVEANYCTVDVETDVTVLTELFRNAKVAIVIEGSKPVNIITRIDLIDYISRVTTAPKVGA